MVDDKIACLRSKGTSEFAPGDDQLHYLRRSVADP
jgi:hypothetical protein